MTSLTATSIGILVEVTSINRIKSLINYQKLRLYIHK
jgi:hypothetical protein